MSDTNVIEKIESSIEVKEPSMYKVLLHNDDSTSMEFVISVLITIFHHDLQNAERVMLEVHHNGYGIAGAPYTREVAKEKTDECEALARANGFPLSVTYEEL